MITTKQIVDSLNQMVFNYRFTKHKSVLTDVPNIDAFNYIIRFLEMNEISLKSLEMIELLEPIDVENENNEVNLLKQKMIQIKLQKNIAVTNKNYELASRLRDDERRVFDKMNHILLKQKCLQKGPFYSLQDNEVIFAMSTDDELYFDLNKAIFHA